MGSCSGTSKVKSVNGSVNEVSEHTTLDRRAQMNLHLRLQNEERRKIFMIKDQNTPQLCITSSLLYNRRLKQNIST
ncbi:hypothetical protein SteCoe_14202 [Stentor coeruleus]|uniref:Uncharacterized protein n=1 Tax=Stentor coeruleus TaxID=5963 RepID=A0A1R2C6K7_9CILI|nr:hypothetical protein SteCoe_14202 [Stentor coeruleus]